MTGINTQTALSQDQLLQQVSMSVAKKSLDVAQAQGDAAIKLLESAAQLQKQSVPGKSLASAPGIGTFLDVIA